MNKILFVCLGNICRSPMAEFIFKDLVRKEGLEDVFFIDSAATSAYNEKNNNDMYYKAKEILNEHSIVFDNHFSRKLKKEDYDKFDYILGMEEENIKNILNIIENDKDNKVFKLLDFTDNPRDIIDPWYSENFDAAYDDIKYGCERFLEYILHKENN